MILLPVTTTIAALAALVLLWLSIRVIRQRLATESSLGDGGGQDLTSAGGRNYAPLQVAVRCHGNFTEYVPVLLILLGLLELAGANAVFLWVCGVILLAGRILHVIGMYRPAPNPFRIAGMMSTFGLLLVFAGYGLFIVWF